MPLIKNIRNQVSFWRGGLESNGNLNSAEFIRGITRSRLYAKSSRFFYRHKKEPGRAALAGRVLSGTLLGFEANTALAALQEASRKHHVAFNTNAQMIGSMLAAVQSQPISMHYVLH
ncbi:MULTISPECIES: hypothetical protein [Paraburkholderia]|jgi:hypothetical protein|uniref:hypothetical protein n=1 Tax=Paraburkholderia TaxID=1822464 RepID=UPI0012B75508|nr:hypothetical protein [Paraburkholderia terricola]